MEVIDWGIIGLYLVGMLLMAARLGREQGSGRDYFLDANRLRPWSLAVSTVATQCSTNSLLGAPAFVGFAVGGGLIWLQYELAVPLAMLLLVGLLARVRKAGHVSVYAFLEERLGQRARLLASTMFLIFRGIATGVTVYGVSIMVTLVVDVTYTQAVLILMAVTILYDVLGGMRAVVVSDVLQLLLIVVAVAISLLMVLGDIGGLSALFEFQANDARGAALDFSWGLDGGSNFGFWPMLFGGLFLYMAYYGCDQSQAQRVLASGSAADAERVLLFSGLLRFPIVALYCAFGLALAVYAVQAPDFLLGLPTTSGGAPNYNLVFPAYVLQTFPPGLVGLILVGVAAAAMSSIDSSLNALSAATLEDHVARWRPSLSTRQEYVLAKLTTLAWGLFAVVFSYQVESIAPTILEAINKVGSVANGPLLGLFGVALLCPAVGERRAVTGFVMGFLVNIALWLWAPQVSWLWWNVSGCLVTLLFCLTLGGLSRVTYRPRRATSLLLLGMALLIFFIMGSLGIR